VILKLIFYICLILSSAVFGQHYFNKSFDLGVPEVYRGCAYNEEDSTIWAVGTVNGSRFPHLYKFDQYGEGLDTVIVKNSSIGNKFIQGYNKAIFKDWDGNILIPGLMQFDEEAQSFAIIFKLTSEGDTIWTREFPVEDRYQYISTGTLTSDGNYIFAGYSQDLATGLNVWLLKLDINGNILWEQHYGRFGDQRIYSVDTTSDGGYVFAGFTTGVGAGESDAYIIKTDSLGNLIWEKWFGFEGNDYARLISLKNGNTLVVGSFRYYLPGPSSSNASKGIAMLLDPDGNQLWFNSFSEFDPSTFYYYSSQEWFNNAYAVNDGYLLYGSGIDTSISNPSGWLVKTDFQGNKLWSRRFRNRDNDNYLQDMVVLPNGDLVFVGFVFPDGTGNSQDGWILRTNCLGFEGPPLLAAEITKDSFNNSATIINSSQRFGDGLIDWGDGTQTYFTEHDDSIFTHVYLENGEYVINFKINACNEHDSLNFETKITNVQPPAPPLSNFTIYPNPANQSLTIKYLPTDAIYAVTINMFDMSGRQVYQQSINDFYKETTLDVSTLSAGTYLIRFSTTLGDVFIEKLVVYR
jgi:hypothetical protein